MADHDFFDLTHLPFDPPEKTAQKVIDAIEKTKNGLDTASIGQKLERDEIIEKKKFLESKSKIIFNNDNKLTPAYDDLAKDKVEKEMEKLKDFVSLLPSHEFTDGTILRHCKRTMLSKDNVKEVFSKAGFTEISKEELTKLHRPRFPEKADNTYKELAALRETKDIKWAKFDFTPAEDLYAFAACMAGEPEKALEYRGKTTPELKALFDKLAGNLSGPHDDDPAGYLCSVLASAGKTFVFDSEDHRQAYETYLKYKSQPLTELFSQMKSFSSNKQDLLDPGLAEVFINKISDIFGCDYMVSVNIYNTEAGLQGDPYVPTKVVFANTAMFAKYFAAAEQALRKNDFELARSSLSQAQSADPGEKSKTDELEARISAEEKKYEKPVNDLRKLLTDKMFQKASEAVADIIGRFPGLNVSVFETQINAALSQARVRFANAGKLSPPGKADECVAILRDCVDFEPAVSFLQSTPPESCKSFSVNMDSLAGVAIINWAPSSEQGVSYRLVRKQGKEIPGSKLDGEALIDNTKNTTYCDKAILPGQWYSYAVFAVRHGVFSSARGKTDVLLADVTDARAEQINTTVRLTWNAPKNSAGVTIRRTQSGKETLLTNEAHGSFEDTNVQYGVTYAYKLCVNYANLSPSRGVDIVITPMPEIESFTIAVKKLKENSYNVSWDINQQGIDLRVLAGGKQVRELKSDAGSCDVELSANSFHTITVLAYSGGNWLPSKNSPEVNTYSPCSIDKTLSSFYEDTIAGLRESAYAIELHLKIGGVIPPNAAGFYYAVRTNASQNHWPTTRDIGVAQDIHRIGLAAYQKNGEILYRETASEEGSYYVSLFTIYNSNGKEIVSDPKPCRFDRPLKADVFWKVSKSLLGGLKLSIEASGNRPFSQVPQFVLCACADDQHLISPNDPKAAQLMTIPIAGLETPRKTYNSSYEVRTDLSTRQLKNKKFFLFEAVPVHGQEFTLRWTKGFTGKI
jgi:hypothetical protein